MKPNPRGPALIGAVLLTLSGCESPIAGPEAEASPEASAPLVSLDRAGSPERSAEAEAPRLPPELRAAATRAVLAALAEWDLRPDLSLHLIEEFFGESETGPGRRLDVRGDR